MRHDQTGVVEKGMEKKVQKVGNSFGVLIDRPVARILGISSNTRVRIITDGRRLIIEPLAPTPPAIPTSDLALEIDAPRIVETLMRRYHMGQERTQELHHRKVRFMRYLAQVHDGLDFSDPDEVATLRRFAACLDALQKGDRWETAAALAKARFPLPEPPR